MGLHDRDYMSGPPRRSLALWRARSVTWWFIVANVVVFVIWQFRNTVPGLGAFMQDHFTCSALGVFEHYRVHTLVTAAFSHKDAWHGLFNMLFLWWFGKELEELYGPWDYAVLALGSAVVASLAHVALYQLSGMPVISGLGASGAVMGIVVVYAFFYPDRQILLYGMFPMTIKWMAVLYVTLDVFGIIGPGDGIGHAAHLGGALTGFLYYWFDLRLFGPGGPRWTLPFRRGPKQRRPASEAPPPPLEPPPDPAVAARVDALLDKIAREGLGSLTDEERSFLEQASRKYRR